MCERCHRSVVFIFVFYFNFLFFSLHFVCVCVCVCARRTPCNDASVIDGVSGVSVCVCVCVCWFGCCFFFFWPWRSLEHAMETKGKRVVPFVITEFYWVVTGVVQGYFLLYLWFLGFYWVSLGFLTGFSGLIRVLLGLAGLNWAISVVSWTYWVLLRFT